MCLDARSHQLPSICKVVGPVPMQGLKVLRIRFQILPFFHVLAVFFRVAKIVGDSLLQLEHEGPHEGCPIVHRLVLQQVVHRHDGPHIAVGHRACAPGIHFGCVALLIGQLGARRKLLQQGRPKFVSKG